LRFKSPSGDLGAKGAKEANEVKGKHPSPSTRLVTSFLKLALRKMKWKAFPIAQI